jgi:hypothetical protein
MPGLWKHATQPISFTLVVDNFGVKYMHQEDTEHLIKCIKEKYELTMDWDGNFYCGIFLKEVTMHALSTYPCQDASSRNCKKTSMQHQLMKWQRGTHNCAGQLN